MKSLTHSLLLVALTAAPVFVCAQEVTDDVTEDTQAEALLAVDAAAIVLEDTVAEAGPGLLYYRSAALTSGTLVFIRDISHDGLYGIPVPESVGVWVHASHVEILEDLAVVSNDGTGYFAVGVDMAPQDCFRRLGTLTAGTRLAVQEVRGDYVRVAAPAGALIYVPVAVLREATIAEGLNGGIIEEEPDHSGEESAAGEEETGEANSGDPVAETDSEPDDGLNSQAEGAAVRLTDHRIGQAFQDSRVPTVAEVDVLLTEVRGHLAGDLSEKDRVIMDEWLFRLEAYRDVAADADAAAQAAAEVAAAGGNPGVIEVPDVTGETYNGRLRTSSLYNGEGLPRLYVLVEVDTGSTIGYVDPAQAQDVTQFVGAAVTIVGHLEADPVMRLNMLRVQSIASGE